jgi:hypothetical protein
MIVFSKEKPLDVRDIVVTLIHILKELLGVNGGMQGGVIHTTNWLEQSKKEMNNNDVLFSIP